MSEWQEIPLFPLGIVLFPGGPLPLRIFEPRYLSMVGRCMRENLPFGVVTMREGEHDTGTAATFHEVGTAVRIYDFDKLSDGMLGISCRGERRFRVHEQRVQPDQLILGQVEWLPQPDALVLPPAHSNLSCLLEHILEVDGVETYAAALGERRLDDANWVADRLTELLPMSTTARLTLLALDDSMERLEVLQAWLHDRTII